MKRRTVVVIHGYLENRQALCERGAYPRHHLWGIDALTAHGWEVRLIDGERPGSIAARVTRLTRGRFGNLDREWRALKQAWQADAVYAVTTADLFWLPLLRRAGLLRAKLAAWRYAPPAGGPLWKLRGEKYEVLFERGFDGVLCLTDCAVAHYRARLPRALIERVDWGVDERTFAVPAASTQRECGFFVCCGKTERDLPALLAGVSGTSHRVRLIVPWTQVDGLSLPPNVEHAGGPPDARDDRGPSYSDLIAEYYAPAIAFLIPLLPYRNNSAGYTNMLEAFAMGKPVVMTRAGCIDIDIEREGVGIYTDPADPTSWGRALDRLAGNPAEARLMGARARALAEQHFSYHRFGERVCDFMSRLCPLE